MIAGVNVSDCSVTGSPELSWIKGRKTVVVVVVSSDTRTRCTIMEFSFRHAQRL